MATKEKNSFLNIQTILLIPGLIAGIKIIWDWVYTKKMSSELGLLHKNENSPIRKTRKVYKEALENAILKAASKIKNKQADDIDNKQEIVSYKDENKQDDQDIVSYKDEK